MLDREHNKTLGWKKMFCFELPGGLIWHTNMLLPTDDEYILLAFKRAFEGWLFLELLLHALSLWTSTRTLHSSIGKMFYGMIKIKLYGKNTLNYICRKKGTAYHYENIIQRERWILLSNSSSG